MHFDPHDRFRNRLPQCRPHPAARARLAVALAAILAVSMTPPTFAAPLPSVPCSLVYLIVAAGVGLAIARVRVPLGHFVTRLAVFAPLLALVAGSVPLSHGLKTGWFAMGAVWIKGMICFAVMLVLSSTLPLENILRALGQLRVPAIFVATLLFMNRYLHVAGDELARMRRARAARTFQRTGSRRLPAAAGIIGMLLVRSFERAERVHAAMLARGFDGEFRTLD